MIGGIALIQGGGDGVETRRSRAGRRCAAPPQPADPARRAPPARAPRRRGGGGGNAVAELVRGANYSLALPTGWKQIDPPAGATFAAAVGGQADATLWIEEDPNLDFPAFVTQSLRQLETLAPDPRVVSRDPGPDAGDHGRPPRRRHAGGQPSYEVLLRAAGPYRYYLALTTYPEPARAAVDGVELIADSFTPEVER